uniref:Uncharacterized protein n=1 Tax=Cacopsylla melanoneura TaxID=428564 RepID=A0A8D9BL22_9HEMI
MQNLSVLLKGPKIWSILTKSKLSLTAKIVSQTRTSKFPSIDSAKVVYNATLSSAGTVGWLITDTFADIDQILENTVELLDNLLDTTVDTGYKLGENGVELTQNVVGGGYNLVENGVASAGVQMEGLSKSFKDRLRPQQLVDVPLTETQKPALRTIKIKANPKK